MLIIKSEIIGFSKCEKLYTLENKKVQRKGLKNVRGWQETVATPPSTGKRKRFSSFL